MVVENLFPIKKNKKPNLYASVPSIRNRYTTLRGRPHIMTVLLTLLRSIPKGGIEITIEIVVTTIEIIVNN
ncbi:hypothetical protein DSCOOX_51410 [Desulfosarcina ovata subsp. ovata]|uniref:Uncharacterized protein n=1 Tax=Desulfosarcina ovata subsp. ovata TaxID=2752305 RepID=A0A5K8AH58_9BACT|nr:hypothetical protein DSCOOX_51410 [Desulfosarcina ovata subsp. ovata]